VYFSQLPLTGQIGKFATRPEPDQSPPPPTRSPATNTASPARPVALSSDEMTVSPPGRAELVGRRDAGPPGVLDTPLGSPYSSLKFPHLHLEVQRISVLD
jgi:hypothetical protein